MKASVLVALACVIAAPALAQKPPAQPAKPEASPAKARVLGYEDALVCYHYYVVAENIARQLEKDGAMNADQAAGFELAALEARNLKAHWSQRIAEVIGKRTQAQVDADLKRIGQPIIRDANAALAGDAKAAARGSARGVSCAAYAFAAAAP